MTDRYTKLVNPILPELRMFAVKLTQDPDDGADLLQDTLLRAYRFIHMYVDGTNFRAWIFRIMRRLHLNRTTKWHKRRMVRYSIHDLVLNDRTLWVAPHDGEEMFGDEFQVALKKIPDTYLQLLLDAEVHKLSIAELTERYGALDVTLRSRLFRARARVRPFLVDYARSMGYATDDWPKRSRHYRRRRRPSRSKAYLEYRNQ